MLLRREGAAEIVVGDGIFGIDLDGFPILLRRILVELLPEQRVAPVVQRKFSVGRARPQLTRPTIWLDRLVETLLRREGAAETMVGDGIFGIDRMASRYFCAASS